MFIYSNTQIELSYHFDLELYLFIYYFYPVILSQPVGVKLEFYNPRVCVKVWFVADFFIKQSRAARKSYIVCQCVRFEVISLFAS